MDIRQLQTMLMLIRNDYNVSRTAEKLFIVQSAVSQQLKRLEQELGSDLFMRKGKRLTGLTELGQLIAEQARVSLNAISNIHQLAHEQQTLEQGTLRIGCTHTQARYILPPVIKVYNQNYPEIEMQIHQGNPGQLVDWAVNDVVDFSICTEELGQTSKLTSIPCYQWNRVLVALPDHPLLEIQSPSLHDLCQYPIITYVAGFTGRKNFNKTFASKALKPNTVLSAADTDIIKTYVTDGLGVGVIASMAFDRHLDRPLVQKDISRLFPWETTRIAYLKDKYIRQYQQTFIDMFLESIHKDSSGRFRVIEKNQGKYVPHQ